MWQAGHEQWDEGGREEESKQGDKRKAVGLSSWEINSI